MKIITAVFIILNYQILFAQTDSLRISWDSNPEPDMLEYRLYRAVNSFQNFQLLQTISHPQINTVDRNNIQPGNSYAFTLMAVDSAGNQSDFSDTVAVGIPGINWTLAEIPTEDTTIVPISDYVTDLDNSASELQLTFNNLDHLIVQRQSNNLLLIPDPFDYTGSAGFSFRVEDPAGFWDATIVSLNVTAVQVNNPPQITSNPVTVAAAGSSYVYRVTATDPDAGDTLTFSLPVSPGFISINSTTGRISGTPALADTGVHSVRVRVSDSGGLTDVQNYNLTVSWNNHPPVIASIPDQTVAEGTPFSAIDLDDYVSDPDHSDNELSWSHQGANELSVTIDTAHVVRVTTPDPDWNGQESVVFTVQDPGGLVDRDTVDFTVTPVNDPPVITSNPITIAVVDSQYRYNVIATDPDAGDVLSYQLSGNASFLSINSQTGLVTGTPTLSQLGSYNVSIRVVDGFTASDTQNYMLEVRAENQPPVIASIPDQTVAEGTPFSAIDLDDYVSDPDHSDNELSWSHQGANELSVTIDTAHVVRVTTPDPDWNGQESVVFTVQDPGGLVDRDTVDFTVTPVNDPPVITLTELVIDNGISQTFDLKPYASDVEDTDQEIQWEFYGYQNFQFSWVDELQKIIRIDHSGALNLEVGQFRVIDSEGLADTATVRLIARGDGDNSPPSLATLPEQLVFAEDDSLILFLNQYVIDSTNAFGELKWNFYPGNSIHTLYDSITGRLSIHADPDWFGDNELRIRVEDPEGLSDERIFGITVLPRVDLSRITFNNLSDHEVRVEVRTDLASNMELSFWVNPTLKSTFKSQNYLMDHQFSLTNLMPDTLYRYSLTLTDTSGYTNVYQDSSFSTRLQQIAEDEQNIYVYPNPYRPSNGHTVVIFDNLPQEMTELMVFTTDGEVVFERQIEGIPGRRMPWTVVNDRGEGLASGLYIYVVKGESGKKLKSGKLAVIR